MKRSAASFRDPSGFVFESGGRLYRQVNKTYQENYDLLHSSGLYDALIKKGWMVSHRETNKVKSSVPGVCYKIIEPTRLPFISYPYEWSFSQLKDAALLTLDIQELALEHGMSLKDASAYNIQFHAGKAIFIDTLSFEAYKSDSAWVAYRQFCQHFLAPLTLMSHTDVRLEQLLKVFIDGIPLDLASRLLPASTRFKPSLLSHVHLHARSQSKHADKAGQSTPRKVSLFALKGLLRSLRSSVQGLKWQPAGTEWGDYYAFTNYSSRSFNQKKKIIEAFLKKTKPEQVWDLGANNGLFSRIASARGIETLAFDIDPAAVEKNYRQVKMTKETSMLPLVMDLTNPSPGLGWGHEERMSLVERGPADMVFALALIHHIAISNNVPLDDVAAFLARIGKNIVIEFVPKSDSQTKKLLATREDIFDSYHEEGLKKAFAPYFKIVKEEKVVGSKRTLYLMERK